MEKKKIKVVIVINDFLVGGAQKQLTELFPLFDKNKFEFCLITLFNFKGRTTMYDKLPEWLPVYKLNFSSTFDFISWWKLFRVLRQIKPDIVMSSLFDANAIVRLLKPFLGFKVITREHNTYKDKSRFQIFIDRIFAKISYKIVAVSQTVSEFSSLQGKIPIDNFLVIHNGIDLRKSTLELEKRPVIRKIRARVGLGEEESMFLNVARLIPQKNHSLLIQGFAAFAVKGIKAKLFIVGDGPLNKELQSLINKFGVEDKIFLVGMKSDVWSWYKIADFFVSTSEIEGFSNAYLEALAAGVPVISTKTAGTDEFLVDGYNGFVIEKNEVQSVQNTLSRAYNSNRFDMKENCVKTAEHYSIERTISLYEGLFQEAICPKK